MPRPSRRATGKERHTGARSGHAHASAHRRSVSKTLEGLSTQHHPRLMRCHTYSDKDPGLGRSRHPVKVDAEGRPRPRSMSKTASNVSETSYVSSAAMSEPTKRRLAVANRCLDEQWRGGEWLNGRPHGTHCSGGEMKDTSEAHDKAWMRRSVSAGQISHKPQRSIPGYRGHCPAVKAENVCLSYAHANKEAARLIQQRRLAPHETKKVGGGPHPANALGYDPDVSLLRKYSEYLSNQKKCAEMLARELPPAWTIHLEPKLPEDPKVRLMEGRTGTAHTDTGTGFRLPVQRADLGERWHRRARGSTIEGRLFHIDFKKQKA